MIYIISYIVFCLFMIGLFFFKFVKASKDQQVRLEDTDIAIEKARSIHEDFIVNYLVNEHGFVYRRKDVLDRIVLDHPDYLHSKISLIFDEKTFTILQGTKYFIFDYNFDHQEVNRFIKIFILEDSQG